LRAILNAARRSADLTAKLLAFGRRGRNLVEAIDLNVIVRDAVTMLQPSFARGPRDVDVAITPGATWTVDGDPSQLNQVIVNLCMNAVDAMPEGGRLALATADVTLDHEAAAVVGRAAGEFVTLCVTDSGHGMTDAVKARIFEPFFTTKEHDRTSGSGLGLSTVHGIVHLHQGAIAVESHPGVGTSFTVWFPRGRLVAAPRAAAVAAGHGHILVVDDEPQLRSFMAAALRKLGYGSVLAVDGEEALRVFAEQRHTLTGVVLDLKMPKKSGRDVFLEIHAIDPAMPILICSGYGDNEEAQALITLGARGLLPKPFRIDELAAQLARLA
jgi:CheY-like chemotaxis protein